MNHYLVGGISELEARAKLLLSSIPNDSDLHEFSLLASLCRTKISDLLSKVNSIKSVIQNPRILSIGVRKFRDAVRELEILETDIFPAITRLTSDDIFLSRLIKIIKQEIHYPFNDPPLVSCLSQHGDYFCIYPDINLIFVPPLEANFFLHLPDLYHELAHPLCLKSDLKASQESFYFYALDHMQKLEEEAKRKPSSFLRDKQLMELRQISNYWGSWSEEFFCDLFAVYTLGPAFAWSHIHLFAKKGNDPFKINGTHPPDDARLKVMLIALNLLCYNEEIKKIESEWNSILSHTGNGPEADYIKLFPRELLEHCAISCKQGIAQINSNIINPQAPQEIQKLLNDAWNEFWENPKDYNIWEREQNSILKKKLLPAA